MSQVTYKTTTNSEKFSCGFCWIAMSTECPCFVCGSVTMYDLHSLHKWSVNRVEQLRTRAKSKSPIVVAKKINDYQVANRSHKVVLPFRRSNKMVGWLWETIAIDTSHMEANNPKVPNHSSREEESQRFVIIVFARKWCQASRHFADSFQQFYEHFVRFSLMLQGILHFATRESADYLCSSSAEKQSYLWHVP